MNVVFVNCHAPLARGKIGAIHMKIITEPVTNCSKLSHHAHGEREKRRKNGWRNMDAQSWIWMGPLLSG